MSKIKRNIQKNIFILYSFFCLLTINAQTVTTFAGSTKGYFDGIVTLAKFANPRGLAVATDGTIFVADITNHRIRKITTSGVVTTFAGSTEGFADGTGNRAKFNYPGSVAVAKDGTVYVADVNNNCIRKITPAGVVTTLAGSTNGFADGYGTSAKFSTPQGLTVDIEGNVYVADYGNNRIRKITPDGLVTTLAGSNQGFSEGIGTAAQFYYPSCVAVSADGTIYVGDTQNHRIRKITPAGDVTTLAGSSQGFADGIGTTAQFNSPAGLAVYKDGTIFVADGINCRIRKITPDGIVTTFAGSTLGYLDGDSSIAQFNGPYGIAFANDDTILIADFGNYRIRKITNTNLNTADFQLKNKISLHPNPTTDLINLDLGNITSAKAIIFDLNGRILQSENIVDNKISLNISNLVNGVYIVQIKTDKGIISEKIVKQ